jgi:hypothetical protein
MWLRAFAIDSHSIILPNPEQAEVTPLLLGLALETLSLKLPPTEDFLPAVGLDFDTGTQELIYSEDPSFFWRESNR